MIKKFLLLLLLCAFCLIPTFAADSVSNQNWQTYTSTSDPYSIKYPAQPGGTLLQIPKQGAWTSAMHPVQNFQFFHFRWRRRYSRIKLRAFFGAFLHSFAPSETRSNPEIINPTTLRSVHSDNQAKSAAVLVFFSSAKGTDGKFCIAKMPSNLKRYISNIQVVEAYDHPEIAAVMNGTVGATKSEAASIKFTGMYQNIPAVGYYIASTRETVAYGAGMWWVTLIAGELSPADRAQGGLSVILHMIQTFKLDPVWKGQSVANAGEVSRQYTIQSQAVSNSIMNRYWSQQAANDANHAAYWGRQAVQDHAANNFSDYIRGATDGPGSEYWITIQS